MSCFVRQKKSHPGVQIYAARTQPTWDLASGPWLRSLSTERHLCTSSRELVKESRHWKHSTGFHCTNGHSYFMYFILQGSDVFRHFKLIMTCHNLSGLFIVSKHIQTSGPNYPLLYITFLLHSHNINRWVLLLAVGRHFCEVDNIGARPKLTG